MKMFGPVAALATLALACLAAPVLADDNPPLPISPVITVSTDNDLPGPHPQLDLGPQASCGAGPSGLTCVFCPWPQYGEDWPWTAPRGVGFAVGPPKGPPYQYSVGIWIACS